jgi:hypothetical protein
MTRPTQPGGLLPGAAVPAGDLRPGRSSHVVEASGGDRHRLSPSMRLCDEVEALYGQRCELGGPDRERVGLTVHPAGRHGLWLDSASEYH